MFKIGKKRESPDVAALNARLNARSPARGDEDAVSLLSADDSPTTTRRSGSFLQADRPDMSLSPVTSNGDVKRGRSGSFLERIRRPVFDQGPPGVPQDGYLGVAGHGPTGFIGDGSLTFDERGLSGTSEDRRLSIASAGSPAPHDGGSRSNIAALATPPAPTLVVQRSSPEGSSDPKLKRNPPSSDASTNGIDGDPSDDESSRGRGIARDRDSTPRPPQPISISPTNPAVVLPDASDGLAALANGQGAPEHPDGRPTLNASTATRGSSRPPSRAASVDGRSPETRPRKLTVSSLDHPPLTSSTRSKSKTKARAGSGGSVADRGIAGALALSGVALASPHPGLAHPRVLRTQHHGSPPASEDLFRKNSRDDGGFASRDVSDSGHGDSVLDGATSSEQHQNDYDVMMSMDTLGNFDDVMEQLGTGYAVASSKRNADFHAVFEDVPDDDYLIEDYGCALQKEILVQGRLYVSEHHICFNSNIFGWVTTLVIPFSDVMTVEKRMTALIIPNAIQVATMHKRHTFTSFLSRDSTYDLITNIWRISHPNVPVAVALPDESVSIDPDVVDAANAAAGGAGAGDDDEKKKAKSPKRKKTKTGDVKVIEPSEPLPTSKVQPPIEIQKVDGSPKAVKVPKAEHHATVCHCEEKGEHYKNVALDTTFPTTPEKIYNLIYQSGFMRTFSIDVQKLTDLSFEDWKPGAAGAHLLRRTGSYVMPLSAPVGPKSTKCLIVDEHQFVDYDHHITNVTTTSTPDVPSGGNFSTITKTCITWAPKNSCRVLVTTQVEWTKVNRFLRSVIESSALAGQIKFHQNLESAIRAYIKQHRNEFDDSPSGDAASDDAVSDSASAAAVPAPSTAESVPAPKATADAKADSSPSGKILDGLSDAVGGLVELVTGQSPMMIAASVLVALLLLSNMWTLSSRHGTASVKAQQGGHEVAMAVRDVLEHYFSGQRPYGAYGGGGRGGVSTKAEVDEMSRVLDALEDRIRTVRNALAQVAEASAGTTGEVTTPVA